jgi:hypothetical protein
MHVVSISGVQATGKTTLARALGAALGAVVFSRDPRMRVLVRDGWKDLDTDAGAAFWIVDTVCSDPEVHRARCETRGEAQLGGWRLTWDVAERG